MRLTYLRQEEGNDRLILIYGGWSVEPEYYSTIARDGWDLAVVTDYDLTVPPRSRAEGLSARYRTVYLYAWSFGVIAAEATLDPSLLTRAYAIAGTPEAISDSYGIPEKIFRLTRDTLTPASLAKFQKRVGLTAPFTVPPRSRAAGHDDYTEPPLSKRGAVETLRDQLDAIASLPRDLHNIPWTRAYIPGRDLIFPPDAQRRSWTQRGVETVELPDTPHAPDFQSIVSSTIINTGHIAENFERALPTYLTAATAQQLFADSLAAAISVPPRSRAAGPRAHKEPRLSKPGAGQAMRILEIGYGAGNLTRSLAKLYPDAEITLVDLYETEPFNLFAKERYVTADAEEWIATEGRGAMGAMGAMGDMGGYDLICSSSAMQWFVNLPEFFRQCARLLRPGGLLAVSMLSKGTLEELDAVRVSRLQYLTSEEIGRMAAESFGEALGVEVSLETDRVGESKSTRVTVEVEEQKEVMEFGSAREALLHLRRTGVNAGPAVPLADALRALRAGRLTYVSTRLLVRKQ